MGGNKVILTLMKLNQKFGATFFVIHFVRNLIALILLNFCSSKNQKRGLKS